MSIIYDYEVIKRTSENCDNSSQASQEDPNVYLVYCYCRGRDLLNNSCGCFGTAKFYGPDRDVS